MKLMSFCFFNGIILLVMTESCAGRKSNESNEYVIVDDIKWRMQHNTCCSAIWCKV